MNRNIMRILARSGFSLLVVLILVFCLFPFYYAIITSFKSSSELFQASYWVNQLHFDNYQHILGQETFIHSLFNSVLVSTLVVGLSLLLGLTASYALGRFEFRGRKTVLMVILAVSMFPQVAVLSGLFEVIRMLGLYNNPFGLVISYMLFTLPFTVWILTTFMQQLPKELEEAAIVDGATPWMTLVRVMMPLLWPALVTTGMLAFIAAWNEFLFALTFTLTDDQRTVPVAIALISGASQYELPWGIIMAASVLVTLPLVIMVLFFQRRIVSGLTAGAVKG